MKILRAIEYNASAVLSPEVALSRIRLAVAAGGECMGLVVDSCRG